MAMRYPGGLIATSPVNAAYPSGVWTQSQTIPYASQNVWQQDQYWRNTTLLLHGDGTNGAQNNTFLDSSSNNFSITRNGNTTQGAFTPYQQNGYWSNYFADTGSTNANYFSRSISGALSTTLSGSTQTREFWINRTVTSTSTFAPVIRILNGDQGTIYFSGGELRVYNGSVIIAVNWNTYVPVGVWTHIALTQSGGTVTLWINGVSRGTSSSTISSTGTDITIGGASDGLSVGYVSNLRISNSARYSSAFTPSTTPFANDGNTTLLICQSNRFVDNSSNAFTFTNIGTPSVQAFQPFPGPTTWSASVLGGSGYFDGTGDYLDGSSSTGATNFGTGDFTVECWVYFISVAAQSNFIDNIGNNAVALYTAAGGSLRFWNGSSNAITGATLTAGQWYHIALVRSSGTTRLYVNGTQSGSNYTDSTNYAGASTYPRIGAAFNTTTFHNGYIADVRCVKSAVYTTTFTPPTSPLTAISNTSLLLSTTNAGIFDNAQMNDLETVGNAQISTGVVKYGTGSLAFNGSTDYLTSPQSVNIDLPGDFTVECWIYFGSVSGTSAIVGKWGGSGAYAWVLQYISGTGLRFYTGVSGGLGTSIAGAWTPSTGVWYHIAVSRSSGSVRLFVNGSQVGTTTTNTDNCTTSNQALNIGRNADTNIQYLNGYIDDLRITKGVARYTANFTPPIARMPNQ